MRSTTLLIGVTAGAMALAVATPGQAAPRAPRQLPSGAVNTPSLAGNGTHLWLRTALHEQPSVAKASFGLSSAIDGNTMVVGAPYQSSGAPVFVYQKTSSQGWAQAKRVATLTITGTPAISFGFHVAIAGRTIAVSDGNRTVGTNDDQGAIQVYNEPAGGWRSTSTPSATLTASDGAVNDGLGGGMAMDGDTIVAGAPERTVDGVERQGELYVFTKGSSGWTTGNQTARLTGSFGQADDFFGDEVAISGNVIVASSEFHSDGGDVAAGLGYLFVKPATGWQDAIQNRKLEAPDEAANAHFGASVAISGNTVAISSSGGYAAVGGAAYLFTEPGAGWGTSTDPTLTTAVKLTAATPSIRSFGSSVGLSSSELVVSAPFGSLPGHNSAGQVFVFAKPSGGWHDATAATAELDESSPVTGNEFGLPVAISGSTITAAAIAEGSNPGTLDVFTPLAKPTLTSLKSAHKKWTLGKHRVKINPKHGPHYGDRISFSLNESATVTMKFTKSRKGPNKKLGTLTIPAPAGKTRVYLDGPLSGHHKLSTGTIKVSISATNVGKEKTPARSLTFHTRKRHHHHKHHHHHH